MHFYGHTVYCPAPLEGFGIGCRVVSTTNLVILNDLSYVAQLRRRGVDLGVSLQREECTGDDTVSKTRVFETVQGTGWICKL